MPTGNLTSKCWFIRVTDSHLAIVEKLFRGHVVLEGGHLVAQHTRNELSWWLMDHTRMLVVTHIGEKTEKEHVHILIELSEERQKQSVDKRYKKEFGVSGPNYSSKPWDGDMGAGAGSYLFHDPSAKILVCHGFTEQDISEFKRLNTELQKVIDVNKQRASGRCVERVLADITTSGRMWTRHEIAHRLLNDIKTGLMYEPGDYVLKRYLEEIYMKQLAKSNWERYVHLRVADLVRLESVEVIYDKGHIHAPQEIQALRQASSATPPCDHRAKGGASVCPTCWERT